MFQITSKAPWCLEATNKGLTIQNIQQFFVRQVIGRCLLKPPDSTVSEQHWTTGKQLYVSAQFKTLYTWMYWKDCHLHVVKFGHSPQKLLVGQIATVSYESGVFHQLLRQTVQRLTWELLAHPGSSREREAAAGGCSASRSAEPGGKHTGRVFRFCL